MSLSDNTKLSKLYFLLKVSVTSQEIVNVITNISKADETFSKMLNLSNFFINNFINIYYVFTVLYSVFK